MKKILYFLTMIATLVLTGCNEFLDKGQKETETKEQSPKAVQEQEEDIPSIPDYHAEFIEALETLEDQYASESQDKFLGAVLDGKKIVFQYEFNEPKASSEKTMTEYFADKNWTQENLKEEAMSKLRQLINPEYLASLRAYHYDFVVLYIGSETKEVFNYTISYNDWPEDLLQDEDDKEETF